MTSLVTESIRNAAAQRSDGHLATALDVVATLLLLALLLHKELLRASDKPDVQAKGRALDIAIVPLLMMFAYIVAIRLVRLSAGS